MNGVMWRYLLMFFFLFSFATDGRSQETADSLSQTEVAAAPSTEKKDVAHRIGDFFTRIFRHFNDQDSNYIEPQHYNYSVMMQNTNTYEMYTLASKSGQSILFAPKPTYRVGPFFGWRWIFLGYTFDISHLQNANNKREFDLSIYSNLVCVDLFYRKTGNDYYIKQVDFNNEDVGKRRFSNVSFDGLSVGITGLTVSYVFNHKKFSYPAAFNQSTVQRRSCGSPLAGFGYTHHSISLDYNKLQQTVTDNMPVSKINPEVAKLDSGLMFNSVKYTDISLLGGYAYNYVPARNWLLAASLSLELGYKYSAGDLQKENSLPFRDFTFKNIVFDGTGRFGVVWNNTKWFAGMSVILHSYYYKKSQFSTNNIFGSLNFYLGFNFNRKKGH